jgi:Mn2+/Fe2+ NRAMP family transporter
MIELLEPLAGSFAVSIFAIGIIAAGVSSQFPNVLMLPWLICDYRGADRDMTLPKYRLMVLMISLLALVVPLLGARPIFVMIISQAFNTIILPLTVLCIFHLTNRSDLMGENKNKLIGNVILIAIFLFSLIIAFIAMKGLGQTIQKL